jgi:hypothetical protein
LKLKTRSTVTVLSKKIVDMAVKAYTKKTGIPSSKDNAVINQILKWYLENKKRIIIRPITPGVETHGYFVNLELKQNAVVKIKKIENQMSLIHKDAVTFCLLSYIQYCKETKS